MAPIDEMSFESKLIALVRENKEIYQNECRTPNHRKKRMEAWDIISQILGKEKIECQQRWRSLRDRYVREVKKPRYTGKEWRYLPLMSFLADAIRPRDLGELKADSNGINESLEEDSNSLDAADSDSDTVLPVHKKARLDLAADTSEVTVIKDLFKNLQDLLNNRFRAPEDDNDVMMKAIAFKMKPLPLAVKLSLQMKFLQEINKQIILHGKDKPSSDLTTSDDNHLK